MYLQKMPSFRKSICVIQAIGALVLSTLFIAAHCQAHPHAFLSASYKVVFNDEGLAGFYVHWVFDEMYSTMTGSEFDLDGDGLFNEAESMQLVELGNESLPELNYFTHVKIDGTAYPVTSVEDFSIRYEDGILYYNFFVKCPVKAGKEKHRLKISPYDAEYFIAMFFPQIGALLLENAEQFNIETTIDEDPDTLIYFDMINPMTLNLEFKRK